MAGTAPYVGKALGAAGEGYNHMCKICAAFGVNIHPDSGPLTTDIGTSDYSLDPYAGGTYQRTATSPVKQIFSLSQVTQQIDSGWNMTSAADGVITWGFYDAQHSTGLYNSPLYNGEGAGYTPFTPAQRTAARESISLWDELIPQSFVEVSGAGASERTKADILLANTSTGPAQAWAYYPYDQAQYKKLSSDAWIADPEVNWTNAWFEPGGYGNTTLIHELGHSLGLSHPGAYNGAGATTYDNQAEYAQDSMQYTIMSYWGGSNTRALTVNWSLVFNNYAQTPMLHDIYTIQSKYGVDTTTRSGDTIYGFNSNAGHSVFDFNANPYPYLSVWDTGGNDTIDLSGFTASQFINLQPGSFSSIGAAIPTAATINANMAVHNAAYGTNYGDVTQAFVSSLGASYMNAAAARIAGYTGVSGIFATAHDNFSIAYGVTIENAIGGSARDLMWGNEAANTLNGMGGNDVIDGFQGADTYIGGTGNDTFIFQFAEHGDRVMDFAAGDKIDVSKIDAISSTTGTNDAFTFIGNAAFGNIAGELRYDGGNVQGDTNGDGVADFTIAIDNLYALAGSDFLL